MIGKHIVDRLARALALPLFCTWTSFYAPICHGGQTLKWDDVPARVQKTVLANGGAVGTVDKESRNIAGMVVYEAIGKNKNGKEVDLVITEDGNLVAMKDDDEADRPREKAARTRKALVELKFSHPREITNEYLPLAALKQDILEGTEDGKAVRIERIARPDIHKTFNIGKQKIEAFVVEDREYENGELAEVAIDYFAQADDGTVLYLGEEVNEYKSGKVISHAGSWMLGKDTRTPGVILPAQIELGVTFNSEDVSRDIHETDEVVALIETVSVPAGTYSDCIKIKERLADGTVEFKYYARGLGVIREVPAEGDVLLKSHVSRQAAD
jgi:hypothetical protein